MKKFSVKDVVALRHATQEKSDYEPMLMMLGNSTAGSDDDCNNNDTPADSLAYNNMLLRRDGTVMTEAHIRELRGRQGYCLTCPGDPVKLFAIKRSKMNPLYQKKEPIKSSNQSENGVCFRCHPAKNPHRAVRRGSLGGVQGPMDMVPGTVHSMQSEMPKRAPRRKSSFGPLSLSTTGGSIGGSMGGSSAGSGSEHSLTNASNKDSNSARDLSENEKKAGLLLRTRSNSPSPGNPGTTNSGSNRSNRSPKRPTRFVSPKRDGTGNSGKRLNASSSTGSGLGKGSGTVSMADVAAAAAAAAQRNKTPLRRATSNEFEGPLSGSDDDQSRGSLGSNPKTLQRSVSSGGDGPIQAEVKSNSDSWDDFADFAAKLQDRGGSIDKQAAETNKSRANSVDSDGFFDQSVEVSEVGFHSSFMDMGLEGIQSPKPATLLSPVQDGGDEEDDDMLFGNNDQSAASNRSIDMMNHQEKREGTRTPPFHDDPESRMETNRQFNQPTDIDEDDKSTNPLDLLQATMLSLVEMNENRFGSLEQQIATVLQQQTLILQQHSAILKLITPTPTSPTTTMSAITTNGGVAEIPIVSSESSENCDTPRNDFISTVPKFDDIVSPLADEAPGVKQKLQLQGQSTKSSMRHLGGESMSKGNSLRSTSSPDEEDDEDSSESSGKSGTDSAGQKQKSDRDMNSSEGSNNSLLMPSDTSEGQDATQKMSNNDSLPMPSDTSEGGDDRPSNDDSLPMPSDTSEGDDSREGDDTPTPLKTSFSNNSLPPLDEFAKEVQAPSEPEQPTNGIHAEEPATVDKRKMLLVQNGLIGESGKNGFIGAPATVGEGVKNDSNSNGTAQQIPISTDSPVPQQSLKTTPAPADQNGSPPLSINVTDDLSGDTDQFDRDLHRNSNGSYGDENLMDMPITPGRSIEKKLSRRRTSSRRMADGSKRHSKRTPSEKAKKKEKKNKKKSRRTSEATNETDGDNSLPSGSVNTETSPSQVSQN